MSVHRKEIETGRVYSFGKTGGKLYGGLHVVFLVSLGPSRPGARAAVAVLNSLFIYDLYSSSSEATVKEEKEEDYNEAFIIRAGSR